MILYNAHPYTYNLGFYNLHWNKIELEQLERLRSGHTLMITHIIESYWSPSQTSFIAKSWPNDHEDIGQDQRH